MLFSAQRTATMPLEAVAESAGPHSAPVVVSTTNTQQHGFIPLQHQQSSFGTLLTVRQQPPQQPKKVSIVEDADRTTPPPFEQIFVHSDSFCRMNPQPNGSLASSLLLRNYSAVHIGSLGRRSRTRNRERDDDNNNDDFGSQLFIKNTNGVDTGAPRRESAKTEAEIASAPQQLRQHRRSVSQYQQEDSDQSHNEVSAQSVEKEGVAVETHAVNEHVRSTRARARGGRLTFPHHYHITHIDDAVELSPMVTAANGGGAFNRESTTSRGGGFVAGGDNDFSVRGRLSNGTSPLRRTSGNSSSTIGRYNWKWLFHLSSYFGSLIGKQEWIFLILLGVLTAILSFSVDIIIDQVLRARLTQVDKLHNQFLKLAVWMCPSILFIMASTAITFNFAPQAIGSGIAHLKTILHGVVLKEYLSLRTLWVKVIGLTLALCSGLPIGKVGPFVHIGAIMARQLGRVREYLISDWRTKTALPGMASRKYDTVSAGCAVGLASCDASPVGGVLFAIEVTSTYFAIQNYWRGFLAALSAALTFRLLSVWLQDELTLLPLFTTKFPIEFPFDLTELSLFVLLGAACGVLGAMYVKLHRRVSLLHRRVPRRHKQKFAYIFPLVFAVGYTLITFPDGVGNYFVGRLWLRRAAMEFLYDSHAGIAHNTNALPSVSGQVPGEDGEVSTIGQRNEKIGFEGIGSDGASAALPGSYGNSYTQRGHSYTSVYSPTLGMFLTTYNINNNPYHPNNLRKHDDDGEEESDAGFPRPQPQHHVQTLTSKSGIVFDSVYNATMLHTDDEPNDTAMPQHGTSRTQEEPRLGAPNGSERAASQAPVPGFTVHSHTLSSTPFDDIRYHIEKFQPGGSVILILCNYCLLHFFCTPISATMPVPTGTFVPTMVLGAAFGRLVGEIVKVLFPNGFAGSDHRPHIADHQRTPHTGSGNYSLDNDTMTSQPSVLMSPPLVLPGAYSVVGAAALLAGVTQTISPAIIAVEMTGQVGHVIPLLLAVLVATSVAKRLEVSIYESIINLLRLPYVPHLDASNEAVHRTTVADIMVLDVRFVTHDCTYNDVRKVLAKTSPKITVFPLVDNKSTMVLIGAVLRSDLQASIEAKLAFRNYLAHLTSIAAPSLPGGASGRYYGGKASDVASSVGHKKSERFMFDKNLLANGHAKKNRKPAEKQLDEQQQQQRSASSAAVRIPSSAGRLSRFIVQPVHAENNNSTANSRTSPTSGMTRATTADTLYNIPTASVGGETGTPSAAPAAAADTHASSSSPSGSNNKVLIRVDSRSGARRNTRSSSMLPNDKPGSPGATPGGSPAGRTMSASKINTDESGELMIARQYTNENEYYKTISSSSPTSCCVMIGSGGCSGLVEGISSGRGGKDSSNTYSGDDVLTRLAWEQQVLAEPFDFSQCKVDISPMQVAETMPLAKVHLVFSLLSVNIVYVTSLGRLVGIATVSDLRRALQSSVR